MTPDARQGPRGRTEIFPVFRTTKSKDLMIRGGEFYAIWDEENQRWSKDQDDVIKIVDKALYDYSVEYAKQHPESWVKVMYMSRSNTKTIDSWNHYVHHQMVDNFVPLDSKLVFANTKPDKKNYSSQCLPFSIEEENTDAYDELMSTLYSPIERKKIEWAIGCIVSGDSVRVQKFLVLIGAPGTGKSTVLDIIRMIFGNYVATIDVKALTNGSAFGLEPLSNNPLVAIQDDADLSRIEDNTKLNSLVSHAKMNVNEKFKKQYDMAYKCFIFLGSNKDVDITDAQSGILRRLIDVEPTGKKVSPRRYRELMDQIKFELGGIAYKCLQVYLNSKYEYERYIPIKCFRATNIVYNCIEENLELFTKDEGITLTEAWKTYGHFCEDANVKYKMDRTRFKTELKAYYEDFVVQENFDGKRYYNLYKGFKYDKLGMFDKLEQEMRPTEGWLELYSGLKSKLDSYCSDCDAQYANDEGTPKYAWSNVKTKLKDISSNRLHYVKLPINHIVIDFDICDENGEKSLEMNLLEANKFPKTYAEVSKSGKGIHLHYIYTGDPEKLENIYKDHVEIKVFKGNSSLRRKLTKCNDIDIATINSGLPTKKEVTRMINQTSLGNERVIRTCIERNLKKEIHHNTKPSIDLIFKTLNDAYNNGIHYDVSDMRPRIIAFAASSTNNSKYCLEKVSEMKWKSDEPTEMTDKMGVDSQPIRFFDVEVFKNLFVVVYKNKGDHPCVTMINPSPSELEEIFVAKMVGFNNRSYDNHICYARMMGYNNKQLYDLSQKIIEGDRNAKFSEAFNLSFTDIYDFSSAANKKSLKKWEIELDIHHHELGLRWDEEVPEELWEKVAEYCCDDVLATEAVFNHLEEDWLARQILADLAEASVNDTTNTLTGKIIFGNDRKPQSEFIYRDLSKPIDEIPDDEREFLEFACPDMMNQNLHPFDSVLPYFDGYEFINGVSTYRGFEVGEGGFAWSCPGAYANVALLDIESQHPHSAIAECIFGPRYTRRFKELVDGRLAIKHEDWNKINDILEGKLQKFIAKVESGELTSKSLANALKTAINSVYGLTSAKFPNLFRDPRNVDNIVAKRGALFMIDLKYMVESHGYRVVHIKTDSIKIADADEKIIDLVCKFGKVYGYNFDHEATYERMVIVDKAQYIARYDKPKVDKKTGKEIWWTATGLMFQIPYVFKTMFTHDEIEFKDLREIKSVKTSMYLDMNEGLGDEHNYRFVGRVGCFCPIKEGCGGGELLRENNTGKFGAVVGSKGYRWLESEIVKELGKEDDIDTGYFDQKVLDAKTEMEKFCPYSMFVDTSKPFETIPF